MTKIYIDECFGKKIFEAIAVFVSYHPEKLNCELEYVPDSYGSGSSDTQWLSKLSQNDIVITLDRGTHNAKEKLPQICKVLGIRTLLLGSSLMKKKHFYKGLAVLSIWDRIFTDVIKDIQGSQYTIYMNQGKTIMKKKSG